MNLVVVGLSVFLLQSEKEELGKAAKKTSQVKSYKFTAEFESPMGGGAGGQIPGVEGFYRNDEGSYVKIGEQWQVARKGDRIAYTDQDGSWKSLDEALKEQEKQSEGQDQGRGRGRGRGRGGFGDPKAFLKQIKAPHEELDGIEKNFDKVSKEEKTERYDDADCAVYGGDLTDEGVRALILFGDQLKRWGDPKVSGKGRVFVNGEGHAVRYIIDISLAYEFNGQEFPIEFTRDIKLTHVDSVQDEMPRDAKEILTKEIPTEEAKPAEEKKEEKKEDR